jgi:hypothetical protein
VDFARRTVQRRRADLRHLFAAMLRSHGDWREFADLSWHLTQTDIQALRETLLAHIAAGAEPKEDVTAWQEILPGAAARSLTVACFASDRPRGVASDGDPLDIDPDVNAFARLICLEQASPPLSIGLFGGWGTGKSTFMETIERPISRSSSVSRYLKTVTPATSVWCILMIPNPNAVCSICSKVRACRQTRM